MHRHRYTTWTCICNSSHAHIDKKHTLVLWLQTSHFTIHSNIWFLLNSFKVWKMSAMPYTFLLEATVYSAYIEWNIPNHGALPSHQKEKFYMSSASFYTHFHIIQHDVCGVMETWLGNLTQISNIKLMWVWIFGCVQMMDPLAGPVGCKG